METRAFFGGRVVAKVGDITLEDCDAIVNAANPTLLGGGGVDGAIHQAGGPQILRECEAIRATTYPDGLPHGEAVITSGGDLLARYVIHTVGPIFGRGNEPELLANCYRNSLRLAVRYSLSTIAFPSISTGVYAFPKDLAAKVSSTAIAQFLSENNTIREIRLVFHTAADAMIFLEHQQFESDAAA